MGRLKASRIIQSKITLAWPPINAKAWVEYRSSQAKRARRFGVMSPPPNHSIRRTGCPACVHRSVMRGGSVRGGCERYASRHPADDVLSAGLDWRDRAVIRVGQELVEHGLDRRLCLHRPSVAHVVTPEGGIHHRDARLLALLRARNHPGVGLELRVLGTEGKNLECA